MPLTGDSLREHPLYPWLALSFVPGVGLIHYRRLVERFRHPKGALRASYAELCAVEGIGPTVAAAIRGFRDEARVSRELELVRAHEVTLLNFRDSNYPENLLRIPDPPPLLYVKGSLTRGDRLAIAVVGSRMASPYGRSVTFRLAKDLVRQGVTVVSGMARGIDSFAHQGALASKGRTIAVLGCGVDVVYPSSNRKIYEDIVSMGAVVSELPMSSEPEAGHFPRRNRIISGLSLGVTVVEANTKSGSLITARQALDQNREVFAVPGNILSAKSKGTHELIRRGAKLVETASDILEEIAPHLRLMPAEASREGDEEQAESLTKEQGIVFGAIDAEPVHIDQVISQSPLSPAKISALLLELELRGLVIQLPGKWFVKA
jgi:DNA processing protein